MLVSRQESGMSRDSGRQANSNGNSGRVVSPGRAGGLGTREKGKSTSVDLGFEGTTVTPTVLAAPTVRVVLPLTQVGAFTPAAAPMSPVVPESAPNLGHTQSGAEGCFRDAHMAAQELNGSQGVEVLGEGTPVKGGPEVVPSLAVTDGSALASAIAAAAPVWQSKPSLTGWADPSSSDLLSPTLVQPVVFQVSQASLPGQGVGKECGSWLRMQPRKNPEDSTTVFVNQGQRKHSRDQPSVVSMFQRFSSALEERKSKVRQKGTESSLEVQMVGGFQPRKSEELEASSGMARPADDDSQRVARALVGAL